MDKELRNLFEKAKGRSQYAMVVVLDIRGFTSFCKEQDSIEVGTYIKKAYIKFIDDYFPFAAFYKPTGDGLLIVVDYEEEEESVKENANKIMNACLRLLKDFGDMLKKDVMISFETPQKLGIGLARGNACCITSDDKILDYSGRVVNLASRLMDMARPSGLVVDSRFDMTLFPEELGKMFSEERVFVRGVSEQQPISVHYTKEYTLIPDSFKQPIKEPKWETQTYKMLLKQMNRRLAIPLTKKPLNKNLLSVEFNYGTPETPKGFLIFVRFDLTKKEITYNEESILPEVDIDLPSIAKALGKKGITEDTKILIHITYPTN